MSDTYTSVEQRASYGIGRQMGDQLAANPFDGVDADAVAAGLIDALAGKASVVSQDDLSAAFQEITQRMQAKEAEKAKEFTVEGDAFLAENAKRDGVTVTESGLQYEVLVAGEGDKPTASSTVRTHYHGTLIDGTVFDSSVDRGEPAEFPVNGVIAGWTEALQLMPVGSKWKLSVPYSLAYGERGAGGAIGPYTTLVFEVELLDIVA
ncbi:FKBP-type peptidyl-prolyl cis-trans isomerase [Dasania marina]|uniref:FKBP-type peptidyl-prolyl cis-trans isomerase n=1 Tax=Dasania marina TaxID=471499 RepID=UPI000369351B|nr:FKBP-type peptidyl-prolyl cis-trans isomerase [Dasania marina]|tara:strand:+ start:36778 stop:37398 length:621 start_codon:yes stop_codon:yes gene_type:complete